MNKPHFLINSGETLIRPFSGLSGSSIYLVSSPSNVVFVRKVATNPETSFRLQKQLEKLKLFQNHKFSTAASPKLLKAGYFNDDCLYIDLEYISGLNLSEYLVRADSQKLKRLGEHLGIFLTEISQEQPIEKVPNNVTEVFYDKTFAIVKKCPWLSDEVKVNLFLNIKNISQLIGSKSTLCHGDLTLENILIDKQEKIWLIDHLDSFFPHYWQDISKLHQDLSGEWFRFRYPHINVPKYTLSYLSNHLLQNVLKIEPSYFLAHYGLLALVFARILPYTTDDCTRQFAMSRLTYYLDLSFNNISEKG